VEHVAVIIADRSQAPDKAWSVPGRRGPDRAAGRARRRSPRSRPSRDGIEERTDRHCGLSAGGGRWRMRGRRSSIGWMSPRATRETLACAVDIRDPMRSILLTALACWATGIAAVVLTADSSQIAAIFPSAGIAMAAALAVGPRALVGAHLGIMAMMLSSGPVLSAGLGTALATGVAAGFVTAGQAAPGAALVRQVPPDAPPPPADPKRIVCLLVLAGPVTCLASTVVSMGVLLTSGHLPSDLLVATGYRLWVADTLGVTVFLPATLAAVARPRDQWRPLLTTAALPMLLAGAVIATAMTRQEAVERETAEREFVRKSSEAARGFLDQIEQAQLILDATHGYVSASEEVTRAE